MSGGGVIQRLDNPQPSGPRQYMVLRKDIYIAQTIALFPCGIYFRLRMRRRRKQNVVQNYLFY